jgi:hypothetical protein
MTPLPSDTLVLHDAKGKPFGLLRLAPAPGHDRGECIFDIELSDGPQSERSEVRWLYKHRFKRAGEHKFKVSADGVITVTQPDFTLVLEPNEAGAFVTPDTLPVVSAIWGEPAQGV